MGSMRIRGSKALALEGGGPPILSYLPYRDLRSNLKTQLMYTQGCVELRKFMLCQLLITVCCQT